MTEVYLNGKYVGDVENHEDFISQLKTERRRGAVSTNINILYDKRLDEIQILSSKGRARRPLIIVKDGKPVLTEMHLKQLEKNEIGWNDLITQGVIEYLDAAEEENTLIGFDESDLTPEHTHMELTPLAMFGLCTALVPFGNFTQPARLSIGSKNQKQAIGMYATNFPVRIDMDVNMLHTPQVPVVKTIMHDISN